MGMSFLNFLKDPFPVCSSKYYREPNRAPADCNFENRPPVSPP